MQLYSARPAVAITQMLWDLSAFAAVAAAVWISRQVRDAIASLGEFGRQVTEAGSGFASTLNGAGDSLAGVPFVGEQVATQFRNASGSASQLASAGEALQTSVTALAEAVGTALWALPAILLLFVWLLPRIRGAVRASATSKLTRTPGGRDLLALRALVAQPASRVLKITPDPAGALRAGDPVVLGALASLEVRAAGARDRGDRVS